jgi:hypothetical protein
MNRENARQNRQLWNQIVLKMSDRDIGVCMMVLFLLEDMTKARLKTNVATLKGEDGKDEMMIAISLDQAENEKLRLLIAASRAANNQ